MTRIASILDEEANLELKALHLTMEGLSRNAEGFGCVVAVPVVGFKRRWIGRSTRAS